MFSARISLGVRLLFGELWALDSKYMRSIFESGPTPCASGYPRGRPVLTQRAHFVRVSHPVARCRSYFTRNSGRKTAGKREIPLYVHKVGLVPKKRVSATVSAVVIDRHSPGSKTVGEQGSSRRLISFIPNSCMGSKPASCKAGKRSVCQRRSGRDRRLESDAGYWHPLDERWACANDEEGFRS